MEEDKMAKPEKKINIKDVTICKSTAQMLEKAQRDGVETAFDRAADMKAWPHRGGIRPVANTVLWAPVA